MKLIRVKNQKELGQVSGEIFSKEIKAKPDLVVGLATGASPLPLYEELVRLNRSGEIDFAGVRSVNLDEYVGLPAEHDQSYRYFMNENLFNHINIDPLNTHVPDGMCADPAAECERYDKLIIGLGGIGLQLLGVGRNGHLGFNEPDVKFSNHTNCVRLTESTIAANARFFRAVDEVPEYAITMGIKDIMLAEKIVLLAGAEKKDILDIAINGDITPEIPASILQLHHDATIIVADV